MTTDSLASSDLPVLTTDRLRLRPFCTDDTDWVLDVSLDPEIQHWVSLPIPYQRPHAHYFVHSIAIAKARSGTAAEFAIDDGVTRQPLGRVGLHRKPGESAEIGFWLAANARGSGVMTDAVRVVCRWGLSSAGMQLRRIAWHARVGNVASRRVAERVGLTIHPYTEQLTWRGQPTEKCVGELMAP
ncbi:GNAT family N-acetyltransferase [Streptomyces sp. SID13666]|uniref:GNAT family N-acetyltransferase n=1 Tax=unclassified Streptomyces TaxID=2593676 RepID=UPI0013BFCA8A|nr:GNAT family N-acetyltransferase [Streptomyces sp. SID13666]NEA73079.1 GNAT family N-acetyltransferase [Streptomyces sp. SID13588]